MTVWLAATLALVLASLAPVAYACRGEAGARLVAVQVATAMITWVLVLMTFAFDQSSFVDLALALAAMSLPGTLAIAFFLERWL